MKKSLAILIALAGLLFGVPGVAAQMRTDRRAELGTALLAAENSIQRTAFRATRTLALKPDGFLLSTMVVECDGKGNVRWKTTPLGKPTTETILVKNRVFRREGSGEWKEVPTETVNGFGSIAFINIPTFDADTTFYYSVRVFTSFFPQAGDVVSIDLGYRTFYSDKKTPDGEPLPAADFRFCERGKLCEYRGFAPEDGRPDEWYETETKFQYDVSIEKIEAPF